jgi:hypothetical protein
LRAFHQSLLFAESWIVAVAMVGMVSLLSMVVKCVGRDVFPPGLVEMW